MPDTIIHRTVDRVAFLLDRGMSRRDRQRWATARSLDDLGALVVAWLHGEIKQTPTHGGPPMDETVPHIPVLAAVNRAGFITDNSQSAASGPWGQCEAWVCGLATAATLKRLREAIEGTPLVIRTCCRRREHHGHRGACPREDVDYFLAERSPAAAREVSQAWHVEIADPEPNRNDRLWPALARFAERRA